MNKFHTGNAFVEEMTTGVTNKQIYISVEQNKSRGGSVIEQESEIFS